MLDCVQNFECQIVFRIWNITLCSEYANVLLIVYLPPGLCSCDDGYSGDDCSISLTAPPFVYTPPDPTCDTQLDKCLTVAVYGEGFANTEQLKCFIEILKVHITATESILWYHWIQHDFHVSTVMILFTSQLFIYMYVEYKISYYTNS